MDDVKSLEELNTNLETVIGEHGEDSEEAKAIQASIDQLKEEGEKFDYKYVKELREEAKKYRTDKAKLKADYVKIQADLKKIEDSKLTDAEKDKKRIKDLEDNLKDIESESKQKGIDNLILSKASGKNFVDMDAVKLFAKKELASEEDIDEKVVGKVLDKLAKDKPYLIKDEGSTTAGSGNFSKNSLEGKKDVDVLFGEMIKEKL